MSDTDDRIDDLEAALYRVLEWSRAYPIDVFPEPDMARVAELLQADGIPLGEVHASILRQAMRGIGEIASTALNVSLPPR